MRFPKIIDRVMQKRYNNRYGLWNGVIIFPILIDSDEVFKKMYMGIVVFSFISG